MAFEFMNNTISNGQKLLRDLLSQTIKSNNVIENYRPKWLNGLELDFWYPDLSVAFEFQGDQHLVPVYGIKSHSEQMARDKAKRRICEGLGVMLITVEACCLTYNSLKNKIWYHISRIHHDLDKHNRKIKLDNILLPYKGQSVKAHGYCDTLVVRFGSPTAAKKGSALRRKLMKKCWAPENRSRIISSRISAYENAKAKYGWGVKVDV